MDRDLYVMSLFLIMTQEIINRFKQGIRLTYKEKVMCLMMVGRTYESWERLSNKVNSPLLITP